MKTSSRVLRRDGVPAERWSMPVLDREPIVETAGEAESVELARENGYKAGFEAGMRDAQAQIEQRIAEQAAHLQALAQALSRPLAELDEGLHVEICELAIAIARQIIRRELGVMPEQVLAVVREAFSVLPSSQRKTVLSLHPDDAVLVRERMFDEDLLDGLNIREDPSLSRGGCTLSTDVSHVDARLETRVAQIAARILGDQRRVESPAEAASVASAGQRRRGERDDAQDPPTESADV